ncbi:MAG: 5-carboxymethyl-2-hydroxymuconate isomerase [Pseudomonadota bacterium]
MPHLTLEVSNGLDKIVDLGALCATLRDALLATGAFPLGGIRVRAFVASAQAVADGSPDLHFADMVLRIGRGRDLVTRQCIGETVYAAAETALHPQLGAQPFALSLDLRENGEVAEKRWNTIHAHLDRA